MKRIDIRLGEREKIILDKPVIALNYCDSDEAFATPVKDIILRENLECFRANDMEGHAFSDVEMVISIVTDDFLNNPGCKKTLKEAKKQDIRLVSILFTDDKTAKNMMGDLLGESFSFSSLKESVEDYLLTALFYEEPFSSYVGGFDDKLRSKLRSVLHGVILPPVIKVGTSESVILAVGSMGYSTVRSWISQEFEIASKVVFVKKNDKVEMGQPILGGEESNWIIGIDEDPANEGKNVKTINDKIYQWLQENVSGRKLVLMGGLGKTTASLLIPLILVQAKKLSIETVVVCTMPLSFEGKKIKRIADRSLGVIEKVSDCLFVYENERTKDNMDLEFMSMKETFSWVGYVIAVAINEGLSKT